MILEVELKICSMTLEFAAVRERLNLMRIKRRWIELLGWADEGDKWTELWELELETMNHG